MFEKGHKLKGKTFENAALKGDLEIMKYLKDNNCEYGISTFCCAAKNGNLKNMIWLKQNGCYFDDWTFEYAAINGK